MSKYTTELRYICESLSGIDSTDYEKCIEKARPLLFTFNYPIFDENYRGVLETKFIKQFYTREIGYETFGLWKMKLDTKLNLIMPYYNKMYESANLEFNPLHDMDITRTKNISNDGSQTVNTESTNTENRNITTTFDNEEDNAFNDTPQGSLSNVKNYEYLTDFRNIKTNGKGNENGTIGTTTTGNANTNINNTEQYLERIFGKANKESYASLIKEYREVLINVDNMLFDELSSLFIMLW